MKVVQIFPWDVSYLTSWHIWSVRDSWVCGFVCQSIVIDNSPLEYLFVLSHT